ncbi:MAG: rhomboid family intramembrane serine protease [Bdellovibrionota bacterium]
MHNLRDGFRVGRAEGDLVIADDGAVSSKHCVFHVSAGGVVEVEDVGSRNGTFVGGKKIEPKTRLGLLPGARLEIGNGSFEIRVGEAPKQRATALEIASLCSQIAPDNIPTRMPGAWSAAAVPRSSARATATAPRSPVKPGELIELRPERPPAARATGSIVRANPIPRAAASPAFELRNPFVVYVFVALNCMAFGWAVSKGMNIFSPSSDSLIAWGGNINTLTTGGQWWRLLTATFAHGGIFHIVSNMAVLLFLGVPVARMMGTARFSVVYLSTGLLGSVASIGFNSPIQISVGASGSIFGIVGGLLALQIMGRMDTRAIGKFGLASTGNFIVRNIGIGVQGIDVAAHTGGLLAGFLITYFLFVDDGERSAKRTASAGLGALALVAILAFFVPHKTIQPTISAFGSKMSEISAGLGKLEKDYRESLQAAKSGAIPQDQFLKLVHASIIPGVEGAGRKVEAVAVSNDREKAAKDAQLVSIVLWKEQLEELAALLETKDDSHLKKLDELQKKASAASANLDKAIAELRKPAP